MGRLGAAICLVTAFVLVKGGSGVDAVTCKTNGGSPLVVDGFGAFGYIQARGGDCCQTTCSGDYCTQMAVSGSARIRICGNCNQCASCVNAGYAIYNIINACTQNDRAAGSEYVYGFEFQLLPSGNSENAVPY